ncbi:unnamed protein product [Eruca vesicaria subsp. sativa]|uniref:Uncharacterized protein n=1 Tax=Eruca vesicaria subsp. sativa TaxID=29727 RepID=A0ABC8JLD4_ERUVS|nr:unnamed protein product [Eruca vesicaria subsp. sativa]
MEKEESQLPPCPLPDRLFAAEEEPIGVRVIAHHKSCGIRQILNTLDTNEVEMIRFLPFGKFIDAHNL